MSMSLFYDMILGERGDYMKLKQIKKWIYTRRYIIIKTLITIYFTILFGVISYRCNNNILINIYNIFISIATGYILTEYYCSRDDRRKYNDNVRMFIKQLNVVKSMINIGNDNIILEYFVLAPYRDTLAEIYNYCDAYNQQNKEHINTLNIRLEKIESDVTKYSNGDYKLGKPTELDIQFCILEAVELFL